MELLKFLLAFAFGFLTYHLILQKIRNKIARSQIKKKENEIEDRLIAMLKLKVENCKKTIAAGFDVINDSHCPENVRPLIKYQIGVLQKELESDQKKIENYESQKT